MSKRGKILKKYKEGMNLIHQVLQEASQLNDEDAKWLFKKTDKFQKEFLDADQEYRQDLSNRFETTEPKVTWPEDDDLPF